MIHNSRFKAILHFSSLAIAEQEFQQAITENPQRIKQHQTFFGEIANTLQQDFRFDISPDLLAQHAQDRFNAALTNIPHDDCTILTVPTLLLLPGLFDIHTHFRTPGQEWKEDFASGSRAALRGGVTSVFDMPNNRRSIITQELLDEKKTLARQTIQVNYGFYFGITDENVTTADQIRGNCGYKVFLGSSTGNLLIMDWPTTLSQCYTLPKPVIIHAEDEAQIHANIQQFGTVSPLDHPQIRNPKVAEAAVLNIEHSLQDLSAPPHSPIIVAHISTYRELEIIQRLQRCQLPVLSEVTLHHLYLDLEDFEKQPNLLKANPPLRNKEETAALQQALRQGAITFVSSDHAPHTLEEKYSDTPPSGVPGMEYNALLLFDAFVKGNLSLHTIIAACAANPSRYFGLSDTGKIETGLYADCTLLNPLAKTAIDNADVQSKAGFTPFHGRTVHGAIEGTIVNGDIGFWHGAFFPTRSRDLFPQ